MSKGRPKRFSGPRPIPLPNQAGILRSRYPESEVVSTRDRLVWRGTLTPSEFSHSYEVVIDHNNRQTPLVYIARPRLERVEGKRLPHVFPWNTLCLHTEDRQQIRSERLADTIVPWTSEWIIFYELWVATGGEWMGGGIHSDSGSRQLTDDERTSHTKYRTDRLHRLTQALHISYGEKCDLEELLYNARL